MGIKKLTRSAALIIMEDSVTHMLDKKFKEEIWDKSFDHESFRKAADDKELYGLMCEMFFEGMFAEQITKIVSIYVKHLLD